MGNRRSHKNRGPKEQPAQPPASRPLRFRTLILAVLLLAAGALAYCNSFQGVFLYDDLDSVKNNTCIRTLWPLSQAISLPLWGTGATVEGRPLLSLTLALNYCLLGPDPWGFHLVNLAIHLCAALTLLGILRRTFRREPLASYFQGWADWVAAAVALVWVVHPIQTDSVTYVVQRAESMMGLMYLLTLYAFIRGIEGPHPWRWYAAASFFCLVGAGVKEVIVTAPLVVLCYDALFVTRSFRRSLRLRWGLYAGLLASWVLLGILQAASWKAKGSDLSELSPAGYAATELSVILFYLRVSFWPDPVLASYGWDPADTVPEVLWPSLPVAVLLALTAWALLRKNRLAFLGVWFFVILTPTSSFLPLRQYAALHRMYLPLAAVAVAAALAAVWLVRVAGARAVARWAAAGATVGAVAFLGWLTYDRNVDFHDRVAFWSENAELRPDSFHAHFGLANAYYEQGDYDEAVEEYKEALRIAPRRVGVHANLAAALKLRGQLDEAAQHYGIALAILPNSARLHLELSRVLVLQGRLGAALREANAALEIDGRMAAAYNAKGCARQRQGDLRLARSNFRKAIELDPSLVEAYSNLSLVNFLMGDIPAAIERARQALEADPDYAEAHYHLGRGLMAIKDLPGAVEQFEEALEDNPDYADPKAWLAYVLATAPQNDLRDGKRALALATEACRATGNRDFQYLQALGAAYAETGQYSQAVRTAEAALQLALAEGSQTRVAVARQQIAMYRSGRPLRTD